MKAAFAESDKARKGVLTGEAKGSEEAFPPLGKPSGAPERVVPDSMAPETQGPGTEAILEPIPGGSGIDEPVSALDMPGAPPPPSNMVPTTDESVPVKKRETKPHPIQGGRQGPIGLAFPPPIEESKPKPSPPSRADEAASWRTNKPKPPQNQGAQGAGTTRSRGNRRPGQQGKPPAPGGGSVARDQSKPGAPEQRVRKEVKIRQGGATDVGSLASRVKNLVLDSTTPRPTREKRDTSQVAEKSTSTA